MDHHNLLPLLVWFRRLHALGHVGWTTPTHPWFRLTVSDQRLLDWPPSTGVGPLFHSGRHMALPLIHCSCSLLPCLGAIFFAPRPIDRGTIAPSPGGPGRQTDSLGINLSHSRHGVPMQVSFSSAPMPGSWTELSPQRRASVAPSSASSSGNLM